MTSLLRGPRCHVQPLQLTRVPTPETCCRNCRTVPPPETDGHIRSDAPRGSSDELRGTIWTGTSCTYLYGLQWRIGTGRGVHRQYMDDLYLSNATNFGCRNRARSRARRWSWVNRSRELTLLPRADLSRQIRRDVREKNSSEQM